MHERLGETPRDNKSECNNPAVLLLDDLGLSHTHGLLVEVEKSLQERGKASLRVVSWTRNDLQPKEIAVDVMWRVTKGALGSDPAINRWQLKSEEIRARCCCDSRISMPAWWFILSFEFRPSKLQQDPLSHSSNCTPGPGCDAFRHSRSACQSHSESSPSPAPAPLVLRKGLQLGGTWETRFPGYRMSGTNIQKSPRADWGARRTCNFGR